MPAADRPSNNGSQGDTQFDVDCIHESGRFLLGSPAGCLPGLFTVRFRAPADYVAGDVIVFKGKELPVRTPGMAAAASDIFKAGAVIHCDIDMDRELAFFWQGVGGAGAVLPNLSYEEQFAGYYAEDGSRVYFKTIDVGKIGGAAKNVSHGITGIKEIIDSKFRRMQVQTSGVLGMSEGNYATSSYIVFNVYPDYLSVSTNSSSFYSVECKVTIYYTKEE